jgi:3-keto-disaccharide hydrolase
LWLFPAISKQNQEDDMFQGFRFGIGMQLKISAVMATAILALGVGAYAQRAAEERINTLSAVEKKDGWKLLFDGQTFNGWRSYNDPTFPTKGWAIEDGCLRVTKSDGRPGSGGGDIMTTEQFDDFDFRFEWRIASGGNSGIKYFVLERQGAPGARMYVGDDGKSAVGHEYQLLDDDKHPDAKNGPIRQAGALYFLVPPNDAKRLKPVGEFNQSRIVVQGKHVEHWLNGAKIVEYELESPALFDAIAKSKYKAIPGFGTKFKTRILLQDHGDEIWFRNLKVRHLQASAHH